VELNVEVPGATLAGTLWTPAGEPRSALLMIPGSGPSDRHNDVFFPPIREMVLAAGHAVASFDKRGVGGSTGSLTDTSIERQASDAIACLGAISALLPGVPMAVFGHSQGGWVVFQVAAARPDLAYAVSSSGPAVGPGAQERARVASDVAEADRAELDEVFDQILMIAARGGSHAEVVAVLDRHPALAGPMALYREAGAHWPLLTALLTHEPGDALSRIGVPTLVIHGAEDLVIPVQASLDVLAREASPRVTAAVLAGADHRLQGEDEQIVPPYATTLLDFIDAELARAPRGR
jgi:uncharacterized protein